MKYLLIIIILTSSIFPADADARLEDFFQKSDAFLKFWVSNGQVDYQGIQNHAEDIEALYHSIGEMRLESSSLAEQKAFYINAYNLIVIYQLARYYPLSSPLDQSGFFDAAKHLVAGESMTLNHLEIAKIMIPFRDPRIHFALGSAAVSCPKLASYAYLPQTIDTQLDERTRLNLNDQSFIRIDRELKKVYISKIFAWYRNDFNHHGQSIRAFINHYRTQALPADHALDYDDYYWALNAKEVVGR